MVRWFRTGELFCRKISKSLIVKKMIEKNPAKISLINDGITTSVAKKIYGQLPNPN
jgi:hypothetical protein